MKALISSCPLACPWPVSSRVITKYWLAGWKENEREGSGNQGRYLALQLGQSITANYHHLLRATFVNWYKGAKTNKKIFMGYEVCGLQTYSAQITFQSWPPGSLTLPGGRRVGEMFGRAQAPHRARNHIPGNSPQLPTRAPSPGLPISSDDAFPKGKWIMSDQKPF